MRVFAGPNGSGKSTIINSIKNAKTEDGLPIDFGIYINADEIAQDLSKKGCDFNSFQLNFDYKQFIQITEQSGLLDYAFSKADFLDSFSMEANCLKCKNQNKKEYLAQIIANYLREALLLERKKFSFETVFSHEGKVEFMKKAKDSGYKVYLYFVSTESPEINVYRIKSVRVKQHGHDVPEHKIRERYVRSMNLLYKASQQAYQSFYFDNSADGAEFELFAHFKLDKEGDKIWKIPSLKVVPKWFRAYYRVN